MSGAGDQPSDSTIRYGHKMLHRCHRTRRGCGRRLTSAAANCGRRLGMYRRSPRRDGHSGIRSEALRGPRQERGRCWGGSHGRLENTLVAIPARHRKCARPRPRAVMDSPRVLTAKDQAHDHAAAGRLKGSCATACVHPCSRPAAAAFALCCQGAAIFRGLCRRHRPSRSPYRIRLRAQAF